MVRTTSHSSSAPNASIRILFVTYEFPPLGGGVATAAYELVNRLSTLPGMHIDVVTSSLDNSWEVEWISESLVLHRVPIGQKRERLHEQSPLEMVRFLLMSAWQIGNLLWSNTYNVAQYFGYPGAFVGWFYSWRVPYIVSLRGVDVPGYNEAFAKYYLLHKPLTRIAWKNARAIVANSQWLKDLALKTLCEANISIIPNGVDAELFKPLPVKMRHSVFAVTAGGTIMGKKKGLQYLVAGFAAFNSKYPLSQLVLFGSGVEEKSLRGQVRELGIEDVVQFNGRVDRDTLARMLPKCHVFCLPSLAEGMSNAMLEAMASGLAIIATPVGANTELLAEERGLMIPARNSAAIAASLSVLYTDVLFMQKLQRKALASAGEYTWKNVVKNYRKLMF